jgi:hypothetical protein
MSKKEEKNGRENLKGTGIFDRIKKKRGGKTE